MITVEEPMAQVVPLPIRIISEGEVRRTNVLIGTGRNFGFSWAGAPAALRFTELTSPPAPTGFVRVRLGDHSLDLGFVALPELARLGVDFAGIELPGLPDDLRLAVLAACLEDPLAALRDQGVALELEGWQAGEVALPAAYGWELLRNQEVFWGGSLHGETDALNHLAGLAGRSPLRPTRAADGVPFAVQVAVAHSTFPVSALAGLGPSDVLLPAISRADLQAGRCELWSGSRMLGHAVRQQQVVKVIAMKQSTDAPPAPAGAAPLRVDELPVQIVFDVGQTELTVGQLRAVAAGYTFELPTQPERMVTIRANGREIGQGELVDMGEKIGVRIAAWNLA